MEEITDECTFKLRMVGVIGDQKLRAEILHQGRRIGSINWCGGVSIKKGFEVGLKASEIKIYKE